MGKKVAALLTVSLLAVSLAGCSGGSDKPASGGEAQAEEKKMTEYSTVYTAEIDTLNYLKTTNSDSIALFYNILDGLVEFDRFGEMIPCIAEKWEVSDDELTYTFHLRDDLLKPSVGTIIFAMCLTGWLPTARFIRNQIVIIRDREFNLASRCLGTPTGRVITKNLLPQVISVIMMRVALSIPLAIGQEVFLTYIGLGLPISIPSLGNLINEGRIVMMSPSLRYQLIFPSIILSLITISFYVMGNSFADAADPRNHV